MRKPVYAICKQQDADQLVHPRCLISVFISVFIIRYLGSIMPQVFYTRNFKPPSSCAVRFVSYLVANPVDRVSRDEA